MNSKHIKLILLFFVSLALTVSVWAQNFHFIYIQTENKQPFYVKMDKNILSSSPTGYLIIPKLIERSYQLSIGFPKNEGPELDVTISVKNIDESFLLKNTQEKGWWLFNLQNNELVQQQQPFQSKNEIERNSKGDEFARILAEVVNDPSIYQQLDVIKQVDTAIIKVENKQVVIPLEVAVETKVWPVQQNSNSKITKLMVDSTAEGLFITYQDKLNTDSESVKVFIPFTLSIVNTIPEKQIDIPELVIKKEDTVKNDSRFIDMELRNPNQKIDSGIIKKDDFVITEKKLTINTLPVNETEAGKTAFDTNKVVINMNCKETASQNDFLNLRKNMAAESNEINMLEVANKQFSQTCFTTEQIKNLCVLFIIEEDKYEFLVAAFPFVSDTHNFKILEDQLVGNYYKTRFKAMLSH